MRLARKTAVVTGGARGIGRAIAARFVAEGARVVIADVDGEEAARTAAELGGEGQARAIATDLTAPDEVQRLVDATVRLFGRLDVLVNNAGIGLTRPFVDTDLAD